MPPRLEALPATGLHAVDRERYPPMETAMFFHFKSRAGGQGSNVMLEIARSLDTQLICICAKNEKLADASGKYRCGKTSED